MEDTIKNINNTNNAKQIIKHNIKNFIVLNRFFIKNVINNLMQFINVQKLKLKRNNANNQ
jgi:hypothetical protein